MDATNFAVAEQSEPGLSASRQDSSDVLLAIQRLDACAASLLPHRGVVGEETYAELVSQAYIYASLLTDCRTMHMNLKDPRIREVGKEIELFCAFLEEEFGG